MSHVELLDSRRLTGPNLVSDGPGAVIDGLVDADLKASLLSAWEARVREVLRAVGWSGESVATRIWDGGVSVSHSAPIDVLYAATEVNEWAWAAAVAEVGAGERPEGLGEASVRLRELIAAEHNPAWLALRQAAAERGVSFLSDDDHASVGLGSGSRTWPVDTLPAPDEVPWGEIHDVPRVLVTGTNGKTTTVRMVAQIAAAAGYRVGFTCTDGIYVDDEVVDAGDWSGPGGARALLRDSRVELAVLETARGGMLRRGLALDRADAALVTNVAEDHLGEWGVTTVEGVAEAKLVLAKGVRHGAPLVINADDPVLAPAARELGRPITWIAVDRAGEVQAASGPDDVAWIARDGWIVRIEGAASNRVVEVVEIPATLGGAAVYNVSNALGAAALAHALGLDDDVIRSGLTAFDPTPDRSPGRTNLFDLGGVRVLVDFVHNPHGFAAVGRMVRALAPERIGVMVGHAGDRDDRAIRDLARAAWDLDPGRVAAKELPRYLRGREPGEVTELIRAELASLGAPDGVVTVHPDEVPAARALLEWSQPGDLLVLSTQSDREGVLQLVEWLRDGGWRPGTPFPEAD
jgi:UDP-N-acetylmuramyl tripeptide synthase